ncbi:MAG: 16S rRNA (cytosine(1402)-N(4))-methyltransferase RsmH [Minisyncoccia bacterium]
MHKAVLLKETVDGLDLRANSIVFDGTLGAGGHSEEIFKRFGTKIKIIATDRDSDAINRATAKICKISCDFQAFLSDYRRINYVLEKVGVKKVDGIVFDLGFSSDQLDSSGRGFSFKNNEPLLMTFSNGVGEEQITAKMILNTWKEETLADILYGYSDEKYSRKIAKSIIEARNIKPIETTNDLVEIVRHAVPFSYQKSKIHFATKTFQAMRMAVNDEVEALKEGLANGIEVLNSGGRIAVISFHSTEDRIVKDTFRKWKEQEKGKIITKKPITANEDEIRENSRSRSAKLRIFKKND